MRHFISPWTYLATQRPTTDRIRLDVLYGNDGWNEIAEDWDRLAAVDECLLLPVATLVRGMARALGAKPLTSR